MIEPINSLIYSPEGKHYLGQNHEGRIHVSNDAWNARLARLQAQGMGLQEAQREVQDADKWYSSMDGCEVMPAR
jgi:hypothetical protein